MSNSAWIQRATQQKWSSIDISSNGVYMIACTNNEGIGSIYVSTNS